MDLLQLIRAHIESWWNRLVREHSQEAKGLAIMELQSYSGNGRRSGQRGMNAFKHRARRNLLWGMVTRCTSFDGLQRANVGYWQSPGRIW